MDKAAQDLEALRAEMLRHCSARERHSGADPQVPVCQVRLDQKSVQESLRAGLGASGRA